jgi:hypothetical protein
MSLPEQEFKRALREYLESGAPDEVREQLEVVEMSIASPGDWELAKHSETTDSESE